MHIQSTIGYTIQYNVQYAIVHVAQYVLYTVFRHSGRLRDCGLLKGKKSCENTLIYTENDEWPNYNIDNGSDQTFI